MDTDIVEDDNANNSDGIQEMETFGPGQSNSLSIESQEKTSLPMVTTAMSHTSALKPALMRDSSTVNQGGHMIAADTLPHLHVRGNPLAMSGMMTPKRKSRIASLIYEDALARGSTPSLVAVASTSDSQQHTAANAIGDDSQMDDNPDNRPPVATLRAGDPLEIAHEYVLNTGAKFVDRISSTLDNAICNSVFDGESCNPPDLVHGSEMPFASSTETINSSSEFQEPIPRLQPTLFGEVNQSRRKHSMLCFNFAPDDITSDVDSESSIGFSRSARGGVNRQLGNTAGMISDYVSDTDFMLNSDIESVGTRSEASFGLAGSRAPSPRIGRNFLRFQDTAQVDAFGNAMQNGSGLVYNDVEDVSKVRNFESTLSKVLMSTNRRSLSFTASVANRRSVNDYNSGSDRMGDTADGNTDSHASNSPMRSTTAISHGTADDNTSIKSGDGIMGTYELTTGRSSPVSGSLELLRESSASSSITKRKRSSLSIPNSSNEDMSQIPSRIKAISHELSEIGLYANDKNALFITLLDCPLCGRSVANQSIMQRLSTPYASTSPLLHSPTLPSQSLGGSFSLPASASETQFNSPVDEQRPPLPLPNSSENISANSETLMVDNSHYLSVAPAASSGVIRNNRRELNVARSSRLRSRSVSKIHSSRYRSTTAIQTTSNIEGGNEHLFPSPMAIPGAEQSSPSASEAQLSFGQGSPHSVHEQQHYRLPSPPIHHGSSFRHPYFSVAPTRGLPSLSSIAQLHIQHMARHHAGKSEAYCKALGKLPLLASGMYGDRMARQSLDDGASVSSRKASSLPRWSTTTTSERRVSDDSEKASQHTVTSNLTTSIDELDFASREGRPQKTEPFSTSPRLGSYQIGTIPSTPFKLSSSVGNVISGITEGFVGNSTGKSSSQLYAHHAARYRKYPRTYLTRRSVGSGSTSAVAAAAAAAAAVNDDPSLSPQLRATLPSVLGDRQRQPVSTGSVSSVRSDYGDDELDDEDLIGVNHGTGSSSVGGSHVARQPRSRYLAGMKRKLRTLSISPSPSPTPQEISIRITTMDSPLSQAAGSDTNSGGDGLTTPQASFADNVSGEDKVRDSNPYFNSRFQHTSPLAGKSEWNLSYGNEDFGKSSAYRVIQSTRPEHGIVKKRAKLTRSRSTSRRPFSSSKDNSGSERELVISTDIGANPAATIQVQTKTETSAAQNAKSISNLLLDAQAELERMQIE